MYIRHCVLILIIMQTPLNVHAQKRNEETVLDLGQNNGLRLVSIPAGKFLMGPAPKEYRPNDPKSTQKEVEIAKGFRMGKFEVTRGQFRVFVNATNYKMSRMNPGWNEKLGRHDFGAYSWLNPGFAQTDDHPAVNIAYKDAEAFCKWLSQKTGKVVRLPFEREWEYACRAGTTTRFHGGDGADDLQALGNVADKSLKAKSRKLSEHENWDDTYPFTAPVGRFKANAWGLHDMHGNAAEWCQDPLPPNSGAARRILRGGNWLSVGHACRSGYSLQTTATASPFSGFRVLVEE